MCVTYLLILSVEWYNHSPGSYVHYLYQGNPYFSGSESWASLWSIPDIHLFFQIWYIFRTESCDIALVIFVFAMLIGCFFIDGQFLVFLVWVLFVPYIFTYCYWLFLFYLFVSFHVIIHILYFLLMLVWWWIFVV